MQLIRIYTSFRILRGIIYTMVSSWSSSKIYACLVSALITNLSDILSNSGLQKILLANKLLLPSCK